MADDATQHLFMKARMVAMPASRAAKAAVSPRPLAISARS
jgi:hypothetical protein